ncbi:hypothetical protein K501DRAFT_319516, partial [Backusella circina FSU 941]
MKLEVLSIICTFITFISCQNILLVNLPRSNEQIHNKDLSIIDYTILGDHTGDLNTNIVYPSTLEAELTWTAKGNPSNQLHLTVASGLTSDPFPGGLKNLQYTSTWRVPNCHFFSRYNPNEYDFTLVVKPVYNNATISGSQPAIIIPLYIDVQNSTFPKC